MLNAIAHTSNIQTPDLRGWKDLYVAALMESDRERMPSLIADAELAIVERARSLFKSSGDHIQEVHAMDDALYALHALKTCLALPKSLADVA
jgi:hypothetical protein